METRELFGNTYKIGDILTVKITTKWYGARYGVPEDRVILVEVTDLNNWDMKSHRCINKYGQDRRLWLFENDVELVSKSHQFQDLYDKLNG
jgi:hypothetical protein